MGMGLVAVSGLAGRVVVWFGLARQGKLGQGPYGHKFGRQYSSPKGRDVMATRTPLELLHDLCTAVAEHCAGESERFQKLRLALLKVQEGLRELEDGKLAKTGPPPHETRRLEKPPPPAPRAQAIRRGH